MNRKIIFLLLLVILTAIGSSLYWYKDILFPKVVSHDALDDIQKKNPEFQAGYNELVNGNATGAIEYFEKSKENVSSYSGLAIIDFNIASAKFEQDRNNGAASYSDLAKDENYPKRTRALALHRAYLMYRRFNDESILRTLAEKNNITWTDTEDVKYQYMQKSYDLYPLPGSSVFLMKRELSATDNKEDANKILTRYKDPIEQGISDMKQTSGELVEATSAMLSYANVLGTLHVRFGIGERNDVETQYKELIQFDQEKNFTTNKQYTFLYYADFLASLEDYTGSLDVLRILTTEPLDRSLIEALPKSKEFTSLSKIPHENIDNPAIAQVIEGIGSSYKQ